MDEIIAILVREPFSLPISQIADLTDYQLRHHYWRPRDQDGALVREDTPTMPASPRDTFFSVWRERGKGEEEIERRWKLWLKQNPGVRDG